MSDTVSIKDVFEYFKIGDGEKSTDPRNSLSEFSKEWRNLTTEDKDEIKAGILASQ